MADGILYIGEDRTVRVTGLSYTTDAGATVYLNDATVAYTLRDAAGAAVDGGSGTLDYVADSDGEYVAVIDKVVTLELAEGATYYLHLPMYEGSRDGYRRLALRAEYRAAT